MWLNQPTEDPLGHHGPPLQGQTRSRQTPKRPNCPGREGNMTTQHASQFVRLNQDPVEKCGQEWEDRLPQALAAGSARHGR